MRPTSTLVALTLILSVFFRSPGSLLHAQPVRGRVLGQLTISPEEDYAVIRVGFNFPVRYVRHFPVESGRELRIRLSPISVGSVDRDALLERESIRPPSGSLPELTEVDFEGDMPGGPVLTLIFQHALEYLVTEGPDFRSILIVVALPVESTTSSSASQGAE